MITLPQLASTMEYPGRFLITSNTLDSIIATYGVTARSASSRAKRYVASKDATTIHVEPTDDKIMEQGNLDLLDYTAVHFFKNGIVIGNGRQTDLIKTLDGPAVDLLSINLREETYEPDKYSTPRITGCVAISNDVWSTALHIIRDDGKGKSTHNSFQLDINSENTYFISTYAGPNTRPTPSFAGGPIPLEPFNGSAKEIAEYIYTAYAPSLEKEDLRVSVVVVAINKTTARAIYRIINSVDR